MKILITFYVLVFSSSVVAEINKNLLILFNYQSENYAIEILHYPYYPGPLGSFQGPSSFKITNIKTSKTTFVNEKIFSVPKDIINGFEWSDEKGMVYRIIESEDIYLTDPTFNSENLMKFHQEENLLDVFTINLSDNKSSYIDYCKENTYFSNSLDKEFINESNDKCFYFSDQTLVTLFDLNFDGENEILILIKHEGQRWSDKVLVLDFNREKSHFTSYYFDDFRTSINITKKIISTFGSGGCCFNTWYIHKAEDSQLSLKYLDQIEDENIYLYQCNSNNDLNLTSLTSYDYGWFKDNCKIIKKSKYKE